ncbi:ADP-ribosylglycohydrolase family protein [Lacrimispora amygdalina]|uniref:ADP-ribosylglycohydrolase family protein n=1 Tax=Lacrimispora amygdalina TaxID=253257 RepID=UPI000BE3ECD9|nr:ADP-ribosylglycohydrolase family protein [Lacrimispora amygdalina]
MNIFELLRNKLSNKQLDYTAEFEDSTWRNEQIMLGKLSGVDTSIYNQSGLSPTLMEVAREQLELGSAPSSITKVVDAYLSGKINEKEFENLCENSIYVIDLNYLKEKFYVVENSEEKKKSHLYPSAFYGACFGDIAGSVYEFGFNYKERKNLNFENCICEESCPTDDTILSCATAKALEQRLVLKEIPPSLSDFNEQNTFPFASNPFTEVYKKYAHMPFPGASYGGGFYGWVHSECLTPYGSYGNGSAMRVSPIAEIFDDLEQVILYSIASASATHNHMEGITGAVVVAVAIWMAKHGYSKRQIFNYIIGYYPEERTKKYIYRGVALKEFTMDELRYATGPTLCQYSVPAAAICFFYAESFEDVINNVLSFDGDTDTIGAIAGSIAGAYYGVPDYAIKVVDERKPKDIFDEALRLLEQKSRRS